MKKGSSVESQTEVRRVSLLDLMKNDDDRSSSVDHKSREKNAAKEVENRRIIGSSKYLRRLLPKKFLRKIDATIKKISIASVFKGCREVDVASEWTTLSMNIGEKIICSKSAVGTARRTLASRMKVLKSHRPKGVDIKKVKRKMNIKKKMDVVQEHMSLIYPHRPAVKVVFFHLHRRVRVLVRIRNPITRKIEIPKGRDDNDDDDDDFISCTAGDDVVDASDAAVPFITAGEEPDEPLPVPVDAAGNNEKHEQQPRSPAGLLLDKEENEIPHDP